MVWFPRKWSSIDTGLDTNFFRTPIVGWITISHLNHVLTVAHCGCYADLGHQNHHDLTQTWRCERDSSDKSCKDGDWPNRIGHQNARIVIAFWSTKGFQYGVLLIACTSIYPGIVAPLQNVVLVIWLVVSTSGDNSKSNCIRIIAPNRVFKYQYAYIHTYK